MKKVCVVSGTRADYGLLKPLIEKINQDNQLTLQLLVTGMHVSPEFGLTYKEIEQDGFTIDEKLEILLSSDTPTGICKSMGLAMIGFAESYARLKPDLIIILGDRYEMLSAASAAAVACIPVAHLYGGETTEGAVDEVFRHSITKMSYLHFTSTEEYRRRVIQLGENPGRVFNVGAIGIENIKKMPLLSKVNLEKRINFTFGDKMALVTFHPVTLEDNTAEVQFAHVLEALDQVDDLKIIFTKANSDTYGRIINQMIDYYASKNKNKSIAFTSMGQLNYLSAMKHASVVVGNSSSGIVEAPSFKVPTVNIGDRQKGRTQASSIINCKPIKQEIVQALNIALSPGFREEIKNVVNPYGDGNVSEPILREAKNTIFSAIDMKKTFYNLEGRNV